MWFDKIGPTRTAVYRTSDVAIRIGTIVSSDNKVRFYPEDGSELSGDDIYSLNKEMEGMNYGCLTI
jgi:hypothetical protein